MRETRNKQLISGHIVTAKRTVCVIVVGAGVSALPLMDFDQQKKKLNVLLYIFSILYTSQTQ